MANAALAFAAGIALANLGALLQIAPLVVAALLLLPIRASGRRATSWTWVLIAGGGAATFLASQAGSSCSARPPNLTGRFLASPIEGSAPFRTSAGCDVRVVLRGPPAEAGDAVVVSGVWREGRGGAWFLASGSTPVPDAPTRGRWRLVRWRAGLVARLHARYGERGALASALILARREGLDPALREAFASTGIAHLLAISGFHVGVVAGMALALLRAMGVGRRPAALAAAAATWGYVALLGFPDAATRAALMIGLVAASRATGRPPARWGALGTALLLLLAQDPERLFQPGVQLSFAGAAGLVAWSPPLRLWLDRASLLRLPRTLSSALAAGVAATLSTLPIVAWHFERVSIVGVPATLLASPLVAIAVPGALFGMGAELLFPPAGRFVAGGVDVFLAVLERGARAASTLPWASVWTSRSLVQVCAVGVALGAMAARRARARGVSRGRRVLGWAAGVAIMWPLLASLTGRGTLQLIFVDVGQGDAIAIRTPAARWLLVDAGPPAPSASVPPRVVRELAGRGVRRLEALVLTHPDLDHIGGAAAVLATFSVGEVVDPARASSKGPYVALLGSAAERNVRWRRAVAGQSWYIDGVAIDVLAPADTVVAGDTEANAASVVLHLRWGEFDALLTGDAPVEVERTFAARLGRSIEVLKVGHHGSLTSTGAELLQHAPPELALVSVGGRNRYGHPARAVLDRLGAVGARVLRTDRDGTVRVVARRDGAYRVELR